MAVGIAYINGPRLARSVSAAADWVAAGRDEINRLNVFPVPDGDTGTNFSLTLRAVAGRKALRGEVEDALRPEARYQPLEVVAITNIAELEFRTRGGCFRRLDVDAQHRVACFKRMRG